MSKIGVETTQHVQLNYKPATVVDRILAYLLDGIVIGAYWILLTAIGDGSSSSENSVDEQFLWLSMVLVFLPIWLYHLISEILWNGFTVGKWLVGIRVVKLDGTRPSITNYLIRWFIRLFEVSATGGGVALLTVLMNGKGQRLGDIAAKTCVIKVGKQTKLSATMFENISENYQAKFPQVMELTDEDIAVTNEILKSKNNYEYSAWIKLVRKTKDLLQKKMGLNETNLDAVSFLQQVVKDYNALHGVLE